MKMSGFLMVTGRKEDPRDPPCLVVNDGSGPGSVRLGGREKEPSFGTVADSLMQILTSHRFLPWLPPVIS